MNGYVYTFSYINVIWIEVEWFGDELCFCINVDNFCITTSLAKLLIHREVTKKWKWVFDIVSLYIYVLFMEGTMNNDLAYF